MTPTPRMSEHARERCREMGLTTKQAKRAFQDGLLEYAGSDRGQGQGSRLRIHPESGIAVVYRPGIPPVIITVLWREPFERASA